MTTPRPEQPITLHRHPLSGHAHRVQLFLSLLGLPVTLVDVDLMKGAHKKPYFMALNPFGQVPVIDDGGIVVSDSNAILVYLALKYGDEGWLPRDPAGAAAVQRWLSVAAGPLAFGPAAARLVTVFGAKLDAAEVIARAHGLLRVMNGVLDRSPYLAADRPTIADVAGYTYVAHAPEGNVSLDEYPHVKSWLARIEALPGFVPMAATKAGLAV
jgi:glutathione S-transferase